MSNPSTTAQQQSRLKELIAKGKEQGFLTYGEVNDDLPDDLSDPEQIEDIIRMINDMGITVYETAPDADELLTTEENTADELAAEEAAEIGLSLGDSMTVNILGRDITGTVTSFRDVDFSNAGMGFVLVMNEQALVGAPHSFIATVYAEPEAEAPILRDIANAYANVTAIRVRDAKGKDIPHEVVFAFAFHAFAPDGVWHLK